MKRRFMACLFLVILLSTLLTALLVTGYARNTIRVVLDEYERSLFARVRNTVIAFDKLLFTLEKEMNAHAHVAMETIADHAMAWSEAGGAIPPGPPVDRLKRIAADVGINEIYIIDRSGTVVRTTFAPDIGFDLFGIDPEFTAFLQSLYGSGRVARQRISVSNNTGAIMMYMYHSPEGSDYIIEISLKVRDFVTAAYSDDYYRFVFQDFFLNTVRENRYLTDLDIYTSTAVAGWSIIREGKPFKAPLERLDRLQKGGTVTLSKGETVTRYTMIHLDDEEADFTDRLYVEAVFDFSLMRTFARSAVLFSILLSAALIIVIFFFFSRLFNDYVIRRIMTIHEGLREVRAGRYQTDLSVGGDDELARIGDALSAMTAGIEGRERALKESEDRYRRLNAELESRVAERTAELETSNRKLSDAISRAEAADRAKSDFLARMSHEIRTPMNGIIGTCDLLMGRGLDRKGREYLNIIRISARSLLGLINDILDFSKIEAGRMELESIPFSPAEVVEDVCDLFFKKIAEKDTELVVDLSPSLPRRVIGDPFRLRQVVTNLVSNAFKFTEGGEVCITAQMAEADPESIRLRISVRDTGIGIPPEARDHLFDAFRQADGSVTRRYGGTGLGLAICKQIVAMMGGEISVESGPAGGANFTFTARFGLPEGAELSGDDWAVPVSVFDGLRVLVVEDNDKARAVLCRMLEQFGCRTEGVGSSEAVLDRYSAPDPPSADLILMDYRLPGIDGITAARQIKGFTDVRVPPIMIISGYIRDEDIERLKSAGIESYLTKPVKRAVLADTIREIFGYHRAAAAAPGPGEDGKAADLTEARVLLVEDNPTSQRVMGDLLRSAGVTVETVGDGAEAVERVRMDRFDAVFMDVQMPGMDGLEATRIIRTEAPASLPIIAMTAHATAGDRERCLAAGMNGHLAKPVDRKELLSAIRRFIPALADIEAPAEETSTTPDGLPDRLPGIDLASGLTRMGGDPAGYASVLAGFIRDHGEAVEQLAGPIADGDLRTAAARAHGLKGAAGNVSAVGLAEAARNLETTCRAGTAPAPEMIEAIRWELARVIVSADRLADLIPPVETPAAVEEMAAREAEEPPAFLTLLEALQAAIQERDPVASGDIIQQIRRGFWLDGFETLLTDLDAHIRDYDFDEARTVLRQILRTLTYTLPQTR